MIEFKGKIISTTALAAILAGGIGSVGANPCKPAAGLRNAGLATECVVPRLVAAARKTNPCAAKKHGNSCAAAKKTCNPCAAKKTFNPSAAKKTGNPCSAVKKVCKAANPCAAKRKEPPELTDAEARNAYNCVSPHMAKAYRKSLHPAAVGYRTWRRFSSVPYPAEAHGTRFMNNYANQTARVEYGKFEKGATMPSGSVLAKDSFIVGDHGNISVGPLYLMSKGQTASNTAMRDWKYTMIMPGGDVREDADTQKFCHACHRRAGAQDDNMMFLPLPFRVSAGANK